MRPKIALLSDGLIHRVIGEALDLLVEPGIKVQNREARQLLREAGVLVDENTWIAKIPSSLVFDALETVPSVFYLYDFEGNIKVIYGGDHVHFDPGSSGTEVLVPETLEHKIAETPDLLRIIKVAEGISQYDAQSTAVVCHDVPEAIQDLYRLYLVLLYSQKPIVTGAFSNKTISSMIDMLALFSGGSENLRRFPRAVFDVCPTPPLILSNFTAGNLITLARAGVPAEIVSMPLAGAAAPATLIGSVTQHAAECLASIVIHQLAQPGSPIVWGGAPAIFDMRKGATPMGAIETGMIDSAYTQVGQWLGIPTHAYLGGTESKLVDAQAGIENGMNVLIAALSGINMISGAGMVNSLLCISPEKLVIDAESIAMARRLIEGIGTPTDTLAAEFFNDPKFTHNGGVFLKMKSTLKLFQKEQHLPGPVIDRGSTRDWLASGGLDTFGRAKLQVQKLVKDYQRPNLDPALENELFDYVSTLASAAGMAHLPSLETNT